MIIAEKLNITSMYILVRPTVALVHICRIRLSITMRHIHTLNPIAR